MRVRRHVHGHVVYRGEEVGAVVEIEARRKYWFALPSPLCWVMTTPGTYSSTSPGRCIGRASISCG